MPVRAHTGHHVAHAKHAKAEEDAEKNRQKEAISKSSPKSLLSTLSSPSIFKKKRHSVKDDDDLMTLEVDKIVKEVDSKAMVNKFKGVSKKVMTTNRMNTMSGAEAEARKKRERADLIIYALFMFFFTLNTIDGLGDQAGYKYTETITDTLHLAEFSAIVTYDGLTTWLDDQLLDGIFSSNFEASGTDYGLANYSNVDDMDATSGWLIQGPVRVAQLRSRAYDCKSEMPHPIKNYNFRCTHSRDMSYFSSHFNEAKEDKRSYRGFDYENPNTAGVGHQRRVQAYSSYSIPQSLHVYPAPAFAVLLDTHRSKTVAAELVANITQNRYLDRHTNVMFIDLSVYNYMLEITQWIRLTAEFSTAGGLDCSYEVIPAQLYWTSSQHPRKVTLNIFVAIGYIYFSFALINRLKMVGFWACSTNLLFWTQLINIAFYLIQLCYRYQSHSLVSHGFMASQGIGQVDFLDENFLDFRGPVVAMRYAITFQSINAFLNWFKLVGYLAKYPVFALMTKTISIAMDELRAFSIVFCIVMFGFAQAHCMFFGNQLYNYRTITISFYTLFRAMLGDFNFNETYELQFIIGPLFFFMFVGIAFLVVLNIIIAIIADAYVEANDRRRIEMKKKKLLEDAKIADAVATGKKSQLSSLKLSMGRNMKRVVPTTMANAMRRTTGSGGMAKNAAAAASAVQPPPVLVSMKSEEDKKKAVSEWLHQEVSSSPTKKLTVESNHQFEKEMVNATTTDQLVAESNQESEAMSSDLDALLDEEAHAGRQVLGGRHRTSSAEHDEALEEIMAPLSIDSHEDMNSPNQSGVSASGGGSLSSLSTSPGGQNDYEEL